MSYCAIIKLIPRSKTPSLHPLPTLRSYDTKITNDLLFINVKLNYLITILPQFVFIVVRTRRYVVYNSSTRYTISNKNFPPLLFYYPALGLLFYLIYSFISPLRKRRGQRYQTLSLYVSLRFFHVVLSAYEKEVGRFIFFFSSHRFVVFASPIFLLYHTATQVYSLSKKSFTQLYRMLQTCMRY